eukprot:s246_g1.t1
MIIIACERLLIHGGYNLWNALSSMISSRSASSLPRTSVSSTSTQTETVYVNAIVENRRNINELKRRDDRIRELEARLDQRSHSDRRKFYAALQLDDFTTRRLNCEAYKVGSKITSLHARQAVLTGAGNIYISNLDKNIDNKALYDTFSLFGNILSCKVASDPTGKSHGYGFVHYESADAAQQAIERVNGMIIGEQAVKVCLFQKRDRDRNATLSLFARPCKLHAHVSSTLPREDEGDLDEFFSQCGPVQAAAVRVDEKGRKFAFVNFEDTADAQRCVAEMHMTDQRASDADLTAVVLYTVMNLRTGTLCYLLILHQEIGPDGHPVGRLYVQRAQTKKERQAELRNKFSETKSSSSSGVNLYVKNLEPDVDDDSLKQLFEPFGQVTSASAMKDAAGKCKGCCVAMLTVTIA